MILSNENEHLVELEWFGLKREDYEVREKYKNWLNDPLITSSLASPDLDNAKKDSDFIEESFHRFTQTNSIGFFIRLTIVDSTPILHFPPSSIYLIFVPNSSVTSEACTELNLVDIFALGAASG